MLSTDLSTLLLIAVSMLAVFISAAAYLHSRASKKYAHAVAETVWPAMRKLEDELEKKRTLPLKRLAEVEASCTELLDSYDALLKSHKKLRSRIGMREHRANGKTPPVSDAPTKDELRDVAKQRGLLR